MLCFTTKGKVYWLKVYEVPVASRTSKGRPLVNMLNLDDDEKVSDILPVDEFSEDRYVFMATRKGTTKKTYLSSENSSTGKISLTFSSSSKLSMFTRGLPFDVLLATGTSYTFNQ
jgi:DNA gyrase subunit A